MENKPHSNINTLAAELWPFFLLLKRRIEEAPARKEFTEKSPGQMVGTLDKEFEKTIARFLDEQLNRRILREDIPVVGEESFKGVFPKGKFHLVDPWDGTHNGIFESPSFGIMHAIIENGVPVLGDIFLPFNCQGKPELYIAIKGGGAWRCFGSRLERITVSKDELSKSTLFLEGPLHSSNVIELAVALKPLVVRIRNGMSCAWSLTRVAASGSTGAGALAITSKCQAWDNLPGCLLVEEAGGKVTDLDGNPITLGNCSDVVCSNGIFHGEILEAIRKSKL